MCSVAWKTASDPLDSKIPVYNCTNGAAIKLSWGEVCKHVHESLKRNPYEGALWYPTMPNTEIFLFNRYYQVIILDGYKIGYPKETISRNSKESSRF